VKGNKLVRLEKDKKDKINNELKNLRPHVPSEICRLPRGLCEIEILLYTGQIVLKGNLKKKVLLSFFIISLCNQNFNMCRNLFKT